MLDDLTNGHAVRRVLLVDDDADDRELFTEALAMVAPGIHIDTRNDGEEMIGFLNTAKDFPNLIFLDLNMPRKNGKECLAEMQTRSDLPNIPVIIYTTSLNSVDIEETYNLGAQLFFRKPNSFRELREMLHHVLEISGWHQQPRRKEHYVIRSKEDLTSQ